MKLGRVERYYCPSYGAYNLSVSFKNSQGTKLCPYWDLVGSLLGKARLMLCNVFKSQSHSLQFRMLMLYN